MKDFQAVGLLHQNPPVNSEFCAIRSSLSTTHFTFSITDVVVDPWSRATHRDTFGLEWGVAAEKLLHRLIVRVHEFFLRAIGQHRAADVFQLRLELFVVDTTDVPGGHPVLLPPRSRQAQREEDRLVVRENVLTSMTSVDSSAATSQSRI